MSLILTFAIKTSIFSWNQGKQEDFQSVLIPIISKIHRLNGGLTENNVEEALLPYMTDSLYVYVFDKDQNPIFLFNQGQKISTEEFNKNRNIISGYSQLSFTPISDGENIIAYLSSDTIDFLASKANRAFIDTMQKTVIMGVIITLLLSSVIAFLFSSGFSKQTKLLVQGLIGLREGKREIDFPTLGIYELDQISQSVLALQKELSKEEQLRQQWMQDISHDLRTPITAVISQFEAMIDGALTLTPLRIKSLLSETRRIEALVVNLQELSRYESPGMSIHLKEVSIKDFVDDIHDRFVFLSEQKNVQFHCSGPDIITSMDESLMQRCMSNIIQNALQHSQRGGSVQMAISKGDTGLLLCVSNEGSIPESDLPHLFDRLYRGSKSRAGSGSGLGLSIAKAIVDLHKGWIKAENRDNHTFLTVYIPFL